MSTNDYLRGRADESLLGHWFKKRAINSATQEWEAYAEQLKRRLRETEHDLRQSEAKNRVKDSKINELEGEVQRLSNRVQRLSMAHIRSSAGNEAGRQVIGHLGKEGIDNNDPPSRLSGNTDARNKMYSEFFHAIKDDYEEEFNKTGRLPGKTANDG